MPRLNQHVARALGRALARLCIGAVLSGLLATAVMAEPSTELPLRLPDPLTPAESKLVAAARKGELADYSVGTAELDNPDKGADWGPERTIRAEVIYALATSKSTDVHAKGLKVASAKITGVLDFDGAEIPHPLVLWNCFIAEPITLRDASALTVSLARSRVAGIQADRLQARGDVFLDSSHATGEVRLIGAKIGGDLACIGGRLENAKGYALYADGAIVDGSVFLNGVQATGEVRFVDAKIAKMLSCSGGTFSNPDGVALSLERASVATTLFLSDLATRPAGTVDLMYAQVGELVDDEKSWPNAGKLVLDGFVYERLAGDTTPWRALDRRDNSGKHKGRLYWLSLQPSFHPQPYEQLAAVLRDMGHEREAREVEIARREKLRADLGFWSWFGDWFLDLTIGYGLKPWRAFFGLVFAFTSGWLLLWGANCSGMMVPTEKGAFVSHQANPSSLPPGYPAFKPLLYDLDSLLPGIDLHQRSHWRLQEKRPRDRLYSFAFVLYYVVWWVSFSLLAAALTGLLKA